MPRIYSINKKQAAIDLRGKGLSFRTIAQRLNISLSTAHLWTKEIALSDKQKLRILINQQLKLRSGQNKYAQLKKIEKIKREKMIFSDAKKEIKLKKSYAFFILGLSLYWAEGFKKDHSLGFVNSDPVMIKVFMNWLKRYGEYDSKDVHPRVQIHEIYKPNIETIQLYWSKLLNIPVTQFQSPFYQKSKSQPDRMDPQYWGLLRIRISRSRDLFIKILGWLEGLREEKF